MNKLMGAADAVAELDDGMTIGIGGWGARRKPMAMVREILRSSLKDLTVVSYGGPDVGLLAAAGKIRKLVFGFVTLDLIPLDAHFRKARQAGAFEVMELDEGMFQWGLKAASLRLPFLPTRAGLATDVEKVNPGLRTVRSPYDDGETLMAMPALELDVALIHVDQADERGNGQIFGPDPYFDDLFCGAAKKAYMSCERVVATERFLADGCVHTMTINRSLVDGVIEAPFGAHPTACVPRYGIDRDHLGEYNAAAESEEAWSAYSGAYIERSGQQYLVAVGGPERIEAIGAPVF